MPCHDMPHMQDEEGKSLLMLAAGAGHEGVVTQLLEAGAPWNAVDRNGDCAGDYARQHGHEDVYEAIVDAGSAGCPYLGSPAAAVLMHLLTASPFYRMHLCGMPVAEACTTAPGCTLSAGCRAEMILAALERKSGITSEEPDSYLRQKLHYSTDTSGVTQHRMSEPALSSRVRYHIHCSAAF